MFKQAVIGVMFAGCSVVDRLSFLPVGPVRRLGCPSGLALWAWRLEDHWGLTKPPADKDRPRGHKNPEAGR